MTVVRVGGAAGLASALDLRSAARLRGIAAGTGND